MAELDTSAALRRSLEQVWDELAMEIANTRIAMASNPQTDSSLKDRERWLTLFEAELGAVQQANDAVSAGVKIPEDQVLVADKAGKDLLRILRTRLASQENGSVAVVSPALAGQ
jgi:hypothetical protein